MAGETSGHSDVVAFRDIKQYEDIWAWLGGPFHYQIFNENSTLRQYYTPVGFLRIRQQRAREKECARADIPVNLKRKCYYVNVNLNTQEKQELILTQWQKGLPG